MSANDAVIAQKISVLKDSIPAFQQIWQDIQKADGGNIFHFDLYTTAVTHRACCIISGFCLMIEQKNFICAAPLVRLHLDSLLRLFAACIAPDLHEFAKSVHAGSHVRNLKDRDGNKMTDNYLVEQMANEYPWITNLYKETSGYVHFSHKHYANTVQSFDEEENSIVFGISISDINIPEGIREEAIDAMLEISRALLRYLSSWADKKQEVARIRVEKKG